MKNLKGALIFAQSGGPTAVINASAAGVFLTALKDKNITKVYGAEHGIKGVLDEELFDINKEDKKQLELLKTTPSSMIGSVRYKMKSPEVDDSDYKRLLEVFKKHDVRYFLYNGGNDSMDTANKISKFMADSGYEINVIGVPKTIDNDLMITDHCPGFGSTAKYIATTVSELILDLKVYNTGILAIIEVMGRDAGYLTASSALARETGYGPDLIYLPESIFDFDKFIADVKEVMVKNDNKCIVCVSEGIRFKDGSLVGKFTQSSNDGFNHVQLGGVCNVLKEYASRFIDTKIRAIELNMMQRCAAHIASKTDVEEAFNVGVTAVKGAVSGENGVMVTMNRTEGEKYNVKYSYTPLKNVANFAKEFPKEWISQNGNDVTKDACDYIRPLIEGESIAPFKNGLPVYAKLKKIKVNK